MTIEINEVEAKTGELDEDKLDQRIQEVVQNKVAKFGPRNCKCCKKEYTPQRLWQKFCKVNCRVKYANTKRELLANEETRKELLK